MIIGAGLGGLCCAACLAKQGVPVTVLEQSPCPGGYATAFQRASGNFLFEVSLHGTCLRNNAGERILRRLGVWERISLVEPREFYRVLTPSRDVVVPQRDPDGYADALSRQFPSEAAGIRGFIGEMIDVAEEVDALHSRAGQFLLPIFPIQYRHMWSIRAKTLQSLLDEYVGDPELQEILASLWGYFGLPPSRLSAFYYSAGTGDYLRNGSYYVKQRSGQLSGALADVVAGEGGKVLCGTVAEQIVLRNGRVSGVATSQGGTLPADVVISNASPHQTFARLLPQTPSLAEYETTLSHLRPSTSSFIVWLGLRGSLRDVDVPYSTSVTSGRGAELDYRSCETGDVAEGPFYVVVYDKAFDGYSPAGCSTVTILFLCGYEPWRKHERDYLCGNKTEYERQKNAWADVLVRRAEKAVIPDLAANIEVREVATPLTNLRFTRNRDGAIYGFEQSVDNAYMSRIGNATPVRGLYLAGAWGNPGGGYLGVLRGGEAAAVDALGYLRGS